jgi:hypothetical protein
MKGRIMIRARKIAASFRWLLLVFWILGIGLGIWWTFGVLLDKGAGLMGTPAIAFPVPLYPALREMDRLHYLIFVAFYLGLFFLSQWFFLRPRRIWKIKVQPEGRPMKLSAIGAAFAVALLSIGLFYSLLDLLPKAAFEDGPPYFACKWFSYHHTLLFVPPALWCLWSALFYIYQRERDHYTWVGKVLRALVGGTILELFVSIPIYVTRQEDCYCVRGSYAGLVFGTTVLLWAFGPGVFLLFIREKHRRENLLYFAREQDQSPAAAGQ